MPRFWALLLACALGGAALATQKKAPPPKQQEPAEEDSSLVPKQYSFNPLQAEKEMKIGDFYYKKGSYNAAVSRYRAATRWNPGLAEAYLRLGESEEKQGENKAARAAFEKFLQLAPKDKHAEKVRKKLAALKS